MVQDDREFAVAGLGGRADSSARTNSQSAVFSLLLVGDLILDEPDADQYFALAGPTLRAGDFVVGQVEVPHTLRGNAQVTDIPAPPSDPENLNALRHAGFNMASLAGNHLYDSGREGVEDTINKLRELGLVTAGAGMNIAQARQPAVLSKGGVRVGLLSYNCVGPKEGWATSAKAGSAYVQVLTHYELESPTPGAIPSIFTFPHPDSLRLMDEDIRKIREHCDVLVVALHKGVGHTPAQIEMYEYAVAHAAIDSGADVVMGHHAHIMQGIEMYRGKPIYHGLGNFVTVTHALTPKDNNSPERQLWAAKREKLFGFRPDPDMPFYPFHPQSRNTIIAKCEIDSAGLVRSGFIPCYIDGQGRPEVLAADRGQDVVDYVQSICRASGLATQLTWAGDWVLTE
jgi:hypothetical protein